MFHDVAHIWLWSGYILHIYRFENHVIPRFENSAHVLAIQKLRFGESICEVCRFMLVHSGFCAAHVVTRLCGLTDDTLDLLVATPFRPPSGILRSQILEWFSGRVFGL